MVQGVWSDDEKCVGILSASLEDLTKPSHSLEEILHKCLLLLSAASPSVDQEMEEEEEEEEEAEEDSNNDEDDDFDDYYDEDEDVDMAASKRERFVSVGVVI